METSEAFAHAVETARQSIPIRRCVRAALAAFGCPGGPAAVVLSSSGKSLALCEGCAEGARGSMRGVGQSWTEAALST